MNSCLTFAPCSHQVIVRQEHLGHGITPLARTMAINKFVLFLVLTDVELGDKEAQD